jgi:hypothetical protein
MAVGLCLLVLASSVGALYFTIVLTNDPAKTSSPGPGLVDVPTPQARPMPGRTEVDTGNPGGFKIPLVSLDGAPARAVPLTGTDVRPGIEAPPASASVGLINVNASIAPPLEDERESAEARETADSGITVETGFECSPSMPVRRISPTHFAIQVPSPQWFMFKAHGVAGKTVRFDIVNAGAGLGNWSGLNPVYSYATDVDDPATYAVADEAGAADSKLERAWNGGLLPLTNGQKWHFIPDAWQEEVHEFSFVQRFDRDNAVVAMRLPYTRGYNERILNSLATIPYAQISTVGVSRAGNPLQVVTIGEGDPRKTPCVLIYSLEHPDEPDCGWVALGAIRFLESNDRWAEQARSKTTFLIIPMLDPDGVAGAAHSNIITSFSAFSETPESNAWADWASRWVTAGKRLDVVTNLHNVQSGEGPHFAPVLCDPVAPWTQATCGLNEAVSETIRSGGFSVARNNAASATSPTRFGGWIRDYYGAVHCAYEINSQEKGRHLNEEELLSMGKLLVEGCIVFFDGGELGHSGPHRCLSRG